jgi:hypothetical protein
MESLSKPIRETKSSVLQLRALVVVAVLIAVATIGSDVVRCLVLSIAMACARSGHTLYWYDQVSAQGDAGGADDPDGPAFGGTRRCVGFTVRCGGLEWASVRPRVKK